MLIAHERGAQLIVSVGSQFNLVEFLDKSRSGMSSTFLTRLRIGERLVDAKGVSRLYRPRPGLRPVLALATSGAVALAAAVLATPGLRDVAGLVWLKLRVLVGHLTWSTSATTPSRSSPCSWRSASASCSASRSGTADWHRAPATRCATACRATSSASARTPGRWRPRSSGATGTNVACIRRWSPAACAGRGSGSSSSAPATAPSTIRSARRSSPRAARWRSSPPPTATPRRRAAGRPRRSRAAAPPTRSCCPASPASLGGADAIVVARTEAGGGEAFDAAVAEALQTTGVRVAGVELGAAARHGRLVPRPRSLRRRPPRRPGRHDRARARARRRPARGGRARRRMSALAPLLVSAALAVLIAPRALRALPRRPNWRGLALPFPAGVIALAAGGAAAAILAATGRPPDAAVLALGAGVALLGLLDDLLDAPPRGWRGHAAALRRGELSTGALKAAGTAALALAATGGDLLGTAAIVLSAHVFNVLDLRPGRSVKAFVLLARGPPRGHARPRAAARDRRVRRRPARPRRLRPARAGDARRHRRDAARGDRRALADGRAGLPGWPQPSRSWPDRALCGGLVALMSRRTTVGRATLKSSSAVARFIATIARVPTSSNAPKRSSPLRGARGSWPVPRGAARLLTRRLRRDVDCDAPAR